jgi:hypothetical protein
MDVKVSEPMAEFFYTQCVGKYDGHMAAIPNNPTIFGVCEAHRVYSRDDFARFLRGVADALQKEQPF